MLNRVQLKLRLLRITQRGLSGGELTVAHVVLMAGIDLRKLERELSSALEADKKYTRENDAKFRAVNQRVASYEEFR